MSVIIQGKFLGNKKVELLHEPSGTKITTAAPVDNNGDGSSFSPTDLVAAALGSCMLTVMAIFADKNQIDLSGMRMRVEKQMNQSPRRIGRLPLTINLPAALSADDRTKLERVALTCPVHQSLHPDIEIPLEFIYDV